MGFFDDVKKIIDQVPKSRQIMLFSATITKDIQKIVSLYMRNPVTIRGDQFVDPALLEQVYYDVASNEKFAVLVHLLKNNSAGLSMVFCGTRRMADVVARNLRKNGLNAMPIHGGLTQNKRLHAIHSLKNKHIDILVATDVAARGLDIGGVNFVYNYDVPKTYEEYIHRIGRTARAGKNGLAITLLSPFDHINFRNILRNSSLNIKNLPTPAVEPIKLKTNNNWHGKSSHSYHGFHSSDRHHNNQRRHLRRGSHSKKYSRQH
jgi:ATP-dependent RNA helicase DeaD